MASQGLLPAHLELVERGQESLRPQAEDLKKRCVCVWGGGVDGCIIYTPPVWSHYWKGHEPQAGDTAAVGIKIFGILPRA